MVVETGGWFSSKKVLISPESFLSPDWESKTFSVNLTQDKIKNSPDIDTDKPVSFQHEELIRGYYSWPGYYASGMNGPRGLGMWGQMIEKKRSENTSDNYKYDQLHLRSTHEVTGYDIHATDGDIGKVEDFILDDTTWKIDFMLVDTSNWFIGKKVLLSPDKIKQIDWETGAVIINATIAEIESYPDYNQKENEL